MVARNKMHLVKQILGFECHTSFVHSIVYNSLSMKKVICFVLLCSCLTISYYSFTNSTGAPAGYTGAPGDVGTCGAPGCHGSTPITSGTTWNNFTITSNIPVGGYTPGTAYTITVSHAISGINKWGFEAVALNSSNAQAGTIAAGAGSQTSTFNGKTYVTHTSSGNTGTGGRSWSFTWTAPNPGVGTVTFYAAVNAANGNGINDAGDQIYTKSASFSQVSNLPTAVIDGVPANGYVCLGDTLNLFGSGANSPTSFAWTFTGLSNSSAQNPVVVFTSIGSKTITLTTTNTNGASSPTSVTVNVVAKPGASLLPAGPTIQICGTDSVLLSTTASPNFSFLWSPGNQTSSSVYVKDSGNYSALVTNPVTGCFARTDTVKVVQFAKPVAVITVSSDSICSRDTLTVSSLHSNSSYGFFDGGVLIQSGNQSTYKGLLGAGSRAVGLQVTDSNGCKSDTARKTVFVVAPLAKPVTSCGAKTPSSVEFMWDVVPAATGYEVSVDSGATWMPFPDSVRSYTVNGMLPNSLAQIWVRATGGLLCDKGEILQAFCTNGVCNPIVYTLNFDSLVCVQSAQDSVLNIVQLNNLSLTHYSVQIGNQAPVQQTIFEVWVKEGVNTVTLRIIDSSNIGCAGVDTVFNIRGVNPVATKPVVSTVGSLCAGDSATHVLQIAPANTGGNYFELYQNNQSSPLATFTNAAGNSVLTYSVAATVSSIHNNDKLYAIATDTVLGCSKSSDTLIAHVFDEPAIGFLYERNGLEVILTDTSAVSATNRNWHFNGVVLDEINAPATINRTFTSGGSYPVMLVVSDTNGCRGHVTQDVVVFNTGLSSANDRKPQIRVFPNPSSSEMNISVESNYPSTLTIELFDLKGTQVATLFHNNIEANTPQLVSFDGTKLQAGIYFCRITTDQNVNIEKLIITR